MFAIYITGSLSAVGNFPLSAEHSISKLNILIGASLLNSPSQAL
jgi:hypothetical protein